MPTKHMVYQYVARTFVIQEVAVLMLLSPFLELNVRVVVVSIVELTQFRHKMCLSSLTRRADSEGARPKNCSELAYK